MSHFFIFNFITGFKIGLEFFLGDDLQEGDKFAMNLDLAIVRLTYVLSKVE